MPLKVKELLFSFFTATLTCSVVSAQQLQSGSSVALNNLVNNPTSAAASAAPTMQDKLAKVRALIAARLLPSAASELEKLKKETGDEAFQSAVRAMLVGVLLEQPNYERAKELLAETFDRSKNRKTGAENIYLPVAGQVIKSAYNQLERYKKFGFNLSDPNLPAEAATDLDRWRKLLETVCEQSKQMSLDEKRAAESLAVLEAAAEARGALARDEYEAAAWRNAVADTREMIANAQTKVTDIDGAAVDLQNVATVNLPDPNVSPAATVATASNQSQPTATNALSSALKISTPLFQTATSTTAQLPKAAAAIAADKGATVNNPTVNNTSFAPKPAEKVDLAASSTRPRAMAENAVATNATNKAANEASASAAKTEAKLAENNGMVKVGSLVDLATRKINPNYPPTARTARVGGIVKVEVVVDEQGEVAEVKNSEGPDLLRRAATDAIRRWKFKPATRDGQAVRMTGFINFNFAL